MKTRCPHPLKPLLLALCAAATLASAAQAGPVQQRVKDSAQVRVCVWPDYYGVTFRNPRTQQLVGIDVDLSAELGKDLGVKVQHVDSSFATLIDDLKADRRDVAMFAVAMLPPRMEHLKFTRPYLQSGIYAVSTKSNRAVRSWADIDKPGVMVAVQAGTFMEPVMKSALKNAELVSVSERLRSSAARLTFQPQAPEASWPRFVSRNWRSAQSGTWADKAASASLRERSDARSKAAMAWNSTRSRPG